MVRGKRTCTADMCVALDVQEENHSDPIDRKLIVQIMSTFCTEPLTISENDNIVFKPEISHLRQELLNVPLETEENEMTCYVKKYCDVHRVHYPKQHFGNIIYHTRTRVYRCSYTREHFPKAVHIFGRWVRVIYGGKSDRIRKLNNTSEGDEQNESSAQNHRHIPHPNHQL